MKIHFVTPTLLSYIDLMSMGGSEKADDATKLGVFCSGLKFSMALAMRNNVGLTVSVYDNVYEEGYDRKRTTSYTTSTYTESCEQTGKEKELIKIVQSVVSENFHSGHTCDYGGGELPEAEILTGYSIKMGIDWELYMLLREIYSNMLDEGGYYCESLEKEPEYGTVVTLEFEEGSEFGEIWKNRHRYINEKEPLYKISESVEALENEEGYLRIYKQNILVYSDENRPSKWAYNIHFGKIDERRVLSDVYNVEGEIVDAIRSTQNEDFLRQIIKPTFETQKKEFLTGRSTYYTASNIVHDIATEVYKEHGQVNSYDWLIESIKKRKDCKIGGKKITTVEDSLWSYSTPVTIETPPQPFSEPSITVEDVEYDTPFVAEIKRHYNFILDVEVRKAKLRGSKVVADKHEKCLIVDNDFSVENDMAELIVEYIDLTQEGNVIKNLSKYILELIKK